MRTGLGISIAANKVPGIRAAVCTNSYMARMSREHNDANILALGEELWDLILLWILLTLGSKLSSREEDMPPGWQNR